jgi:hypothetical protein
MSISSGDIGRLSVELQARFPEEDNASRLDGWLASADIDEEAFETLIQSAITGFLQLLQERIQKGGDERIEAEDADGRRIEMFGLDVGSLVGSIACNMFILGFETATEYGKRDMSHVE